MSKIDIYSFLARGILTENSLDSTHRLKSYSNSNVLDKSVLEKLPYSQIDEKLIADARRMGSVFIVITAFENTIRQYIERVMVDTHGDTWWEDKVPEKVKKKVTARIDKEKKVPWHSPRGGKPLNYTDFGDLADLIISLWEQFEQEVQDQGKMKNVFDTIELSRNACMHGGVISDRDIERVGMQMRDWLEQLGLG